MKDHHPSQSGFTLIEMMIVIAIIAIIAAIAVPSFGRLISNHNTQKGAEDIVNAFNQARTQAALISKNFNVAIDNTRRVYSIKYTDKDNTVITVRRYELPARLNVTTNVPSRIHALPLGTLITDPSTSVLVFRVCDNEYSGETGHTVWINSNGIARVVVGKASGVGNDTITNVDCN